MREPVGGAVLTADPEQAPDGGAQCVQTLVSIDSGPNKGANTVLEFSGGPGQPNLAVGDHIRISRQVDAAGATSYAFYDYERTWPLIASPRCSPSSSSRSPAGADCGR